MNAPLLKQKNGAAVSTGSQQAIIPKAKIRQKPVPQPFKQNRSSRCEWEARRASENFDRNLPLSTGPFSFCAASAFRVKESTGQPLSNPIRSELETHFNADLSAVRLHTDSPAARAAEAAGAKAFAAGSHIYFSDKHGPSTGYDGKKRLAHEVAHVLQQTGRRTHEGKLKVTDTSGTGGIQCDPIPGENAPTLANLFQFLVDQHRTQALADGDSRSEFNAFTQAVRDITGTEISAWQAAHMMRRNRIDVHTSGTRLTGIPDSAQAVLDFSGETHRARRSFLFDWLKSMGQNQNAARLLEGDPEIKTLHLNMDFMGFLNRDEGFGANWIASLLSSHPLVHRFWNNGFYDSIHRYLLSINRPVQGIYGGFNQRFNEVLEHGENWRQLTDNERAVSALTYLHQIGRERTQIFGRFEQQAAGIPLHRKRIFLSQNVAVYSRTLIASPSPVVRAMGQRILTLANQAESFWTDLAPIYDIGLNILRASSPSEVQNLRRTLPFYSLLNQTAVLSLHRTLRTGAQNLFRLGNQRQIPDITAYNTQRGQFLGTVNGIIRDYTSQWYEDMDSERSRQNHLMMQWRVFTLFFLHLLKSHLRSFVIRDAQIDARNSRGSADHQLANRRRVAPVLRNMGIIMGWRDVITLAEDVITGRDVGRSYLALVGNWTAQPNVGFERMRIDFRTVNWGENELPFRPSQMVAFFQLHYYQRMNDVLNTILDREETTLERPRRGFLTRARREADRLPRPQRWVIQDFQFVLNADESTSYFQLIYNHPKTQQFIAQHVPRNYSWALPNGDAERVFAWVIPPILPLYDMLIQDDHLNTLAVENGAPDRANVHNPTQLQQWITAILRSGRTLDYILNSVSRVLREEREQTVSALNRQYQRITNHSRRILVGSLSTQLRRYAEQTIHGNYAIPNRVLSSIRDFRAGVQPQSDNEHQRAALVLGLAPALKAAFVREHWFGNVVEERFDIITGYFNLLSEVSEFARSDGATIDLTTILHESESARDLLRKDTDLQTIINSFQGTRTRMQEEFGIQVRNGQLRSLQQNSQVFTIQDGPPIRFEGREYRLRYVSDQPFTFYATYGRGGAAELPGRVLNAAGAEFGTSDGDPHRLLLRFEVRPIQNEGEPAQAWAQWPVRSDNISRLDSLTYALGSAAIQERLRRLGTTMEAFAEGMVIVLQLVPGVGQGVRLAMIVADIARFLIEDLPQIREALQNNPSEMVEQLITDFEEAFTPDNLWRYILTGANMPLRARRETRSSSRPRPVVRRRRGALGQLIRHAQGIYRRFRTGMERFQQRTRGPVMRAQSQVATHPRVSAFMRAMSYGAVLSPTSFQDAIFEEAARGPGEVSDSIASMLHALQQMEIPGTVLPMQLLTNAVVIFFLNRFGGRGRAVRAALEGLGVLDQITRPISEALTNTRVDPNRVWRDRLVPRVQTRFNQSRDEMVAALYDIINTTLRAAGEEPMTPPADENITVQITDETPELEASSTSTLLSDISIPVSKAVAGGKPLSGIMRREAEGKLGHDFSHVRLHTGAESMARMPGIHALTSGSHIHLKPGLSPVTGRGRKTLYHELTHVLQQTGPRPYHKRQPAIPVPGQPGKGLRIDTARERQAENLAAQLTSGQKPGPVQSGPAMQGLMPSISDAAMFSFRYLSNADLRTRYLQDISGATVPTGTVPGLSDAQRIWNSFRSMITENSSSNVRYADFLNETNLKDQIKQQILSVLRQQVRLTQSRLAVCAGVRGGSPQRLKARLFTDIFEGYIFAKCGIILQINIDTNPLDVERVSIVSVHLPYVTRSQIRDIARTNTQRFIQSASSRTQGWTSLNTSDWEFLMGLVRGRGPVPGIWDTGSFHFHRNLVQAVHENRRRRIPNPFPTWGTYTAPLSNSNTPGLRVKTHRELKALPASYPTVVPDEASRAAPRQDRDSHHIPQYLLLEYFRGKSDPSPLITGRLLPGFDTESGAHPRTFRHGTHNINLYNLEHNRGDNMAAVLISEETHQRGELHCVSERLTGVTSGSRTQARGLHNHFLRRMQHHLGMSASVTPESLATHGEDHETETRSAVYNSMKDCYDFLYNQRMKPQLRQALSTHETAYYIAGARRTSANLRNGRLRLYNPFRAMSLLDRTMEAIEQKNREIYPAWR